VQQMLDRYI